MCCSAHSKCMYVTNSAESTHVTVVWSPCNGHIRNSLHGNNTAIFFSFQSLWECELLYFCSGTRFPEWVHCNIEYSFTFHGTVMPPCCIVVHCILQFVSVQPNIHGTGEWCAASIEAWVYSLVICEPRFWDFSTPSLFVGSHRHRSLRLTIATPLSGISREEPEAPACM